MATPIDQRVEKLLALSDKRGMIVDTLCVNGNQILITYATAKPKTATADADLIDWSRK